MLGAAERERMVRAVRSVQRELAAVEATAETDDGMVTATVGPRGELRALELDPRVYRTRDPDELAEDILRTVRSAEDDAAHAAYDAATEVLPPHTRFEDADVAFDPLLHRLGKGRHDIPCVSHVEFRRGGALVTDGANIDPAGVAGALAALRAAGDRFAAGWAAAGGTINALAGGLGNGPLGQAFMAAYRPGAEAVARSADEGSRVPGVYADTGAQCVAGYVSADGTSAAAIGSAGGHGTS